MNKLLFLVLCLSSVSAQALPLVSVQEQVRAELWHKGVARLKPQALSTSTKGPKPRLNEELQRALVKYKL